MRLEGNTTVSLILKGFRYDHQLRYKVFISSNLNPSSIKVNCQVSRDIDTNVGQIGSRQCKDKGSPCCVPQETKNRL